MRGIKVLAVFAGVILLSGVLRQLPHRERGTAEPFDNREQVVASIRKGLRSHAKSITVRFSSPNAVGADLVSAAETWVEEAMGETEDEAEGDYIRYQCGGYRVSCVREQGDGQDTCTVRIVPEYYLYLAQEEAVSGKLDEIFSGFGFTEDSSAYDKARTVYDYVCQNVKYDEIHAKNPHYHLKSTAYAALIQGSAACQGYSTALYRMLRRAGINCRIVTGMGDGARGREFHAWNIAELDGVWYSLDATWDAGKPEYEWFLLGTGHFTRHIPGDAFSPWPTLYTFSEEDCGNKFEKAS